MRDLLRRHPGLNDWIEQLLEDDELVPPHLQPDVVRSYRPVPDSRGPISATKYVCPTGDGFTWYRSPTARPMACCPICGSAPGDGGDRYTPAELDERDHFLTARWILYSVSGSRYRLARACHQPWPLHRAQVRAVDDRLIQAAGLPHPQGEPLAHYSPGVDVAIGRPERCR